VTSTIKILVVDDIDENVVALEALLRRDGLELLKARSGSEALELLLVNDVSLALLDVQMPEMDGFELAELMRGSERTKHVPIIFVTAGARDPYRVFKGYETGAVDFLYKPIDPHILRSKVDVFIELARQRLQLAEALRLNEMFVGVVGHDLRNPLGAVVAGAELLRETVTDPVSQRTVERMITAGHRMTEMIEQLVDLTRGRLGGGVGFVRARVYLDIEELVQRAVDELRAAHPTCTIQIDSAGECVTTGDPQRLLQVFSNLLGNAVTHGAKQGSITVSIVGRDRDVMISVRNDGVVPSEVLPVLFEPFRGSNRPTSGGLGLGMYIAREIARGHGGDITVESNPRDGTTVAVVLPRRTDVLASAPGSGSDPSILPTPHSPGGSVLIVEDEDDVREALREALEGKKYRVATAANGKEALELLMGKRPLPDVVIFDLQMPILDGVAMYRAMQQHPQLSSIPVMVSTADPAKAPAGVLVLPKPLELARLLDEIASLQHKAS
jgi:two-component system, sensor histidine kinase and response regulator